MPKFHKAVDGVARVEKTYIHMLKCIYTHAYIHTHTHTFIHTYTHTYAHTKYNAEHSRT